MHCDKREHLVGKLILNNYLIQYKLGENWLVKIYSCTDINTNHNYTIKLVRKNNLIKYNIILGKKIR